MRNHLATLAMTLAFVFTGAAQAQPQPHAGEIAAGIRRLGTVGSVLYVAAHPDDENTRFLAWLVGDRGLRAGYLSLTRGDGGQNLIGTEQDELLGLIRTQELLAARRVDGAEQLFTRARDFGYSKSADETLKIWDRAQVLGDVVLAIRRFRPDVVVTRFTPDPPNHGHHTASAVLAAEAFRLAADPKAYPEHGLPAWQADRLLHNVSTWRLPKDADMSAYLKLDVGTYDPLRGRSWGEVAAESRSQHKSQGFGAAVDRGPLFEYFAPVAGTQPKADVFEGLDFGWKRFGAAQVAAAAAEAEKNFDPRAPHASIPALLKVRTALAALPDANPWKHVKLREVDRLVAACAGLYADVRAAEPSGVPGGEVALALTAIARSPAALKLVDVTLPGGAKVEGAALANNEPWRVEQKLTLPADAPISTPYWLREPADGGLYRVADRALVGRPEGDPPLSATFTFDIAGQRLAVTRPVTFVWVDPVRGELSRLFEVAPAVSATLDREVFMFPNGRPQTVSVTLAAGRPASGTARLELPDGWKSVPASVSFALDARGAERTVAFTVTPAANAARATVRAVVDVDGRSESWRVRTVNYDHIPPQTVRQPSTAALVPVALESRVRRIAYIPGPGDKVAESLAAVGYDVTILPDERLASEKLDRFEAIVVGIRAFNANPRLTVHRDRLMQYVERGGRLVVQYNTNSRIGPLPVQVGPYPLEIGRERVTDESAAMTAVNPKEPLLSAPNRLGAADFTGWVQERGLYFATKWDPKYRPVFAMNDPGEQPLQGSTLVAKHGKGTFVYTGIAFFRQLPAGVPGAYRLMANLLNLKAK
jgi:LmbE family N-acetylglucosaminyl deacetylase